MIRGNIKDGKVTLKDGEHIVDKTHPFLLKAGLSSKPLYLMKWNSLYPMTFEIKDKTTTLKNEATGESFTMTQKELVPVDPKFYEGKGEGDKSLQYNPKVLKDTQDQRFLRGMTKYAGGGGGGIDAKTIMTIIFMIVILGAAGILIYMLFTGQLKF